MNTEDNNQEASVELENNAGEGSDTEADTISISKSEYEKMNQNLGSLKRELKDLKKAKEEPRETPTTNQTKPDDALLQRVEKLALKTAGIDHADDIELARTTAKKWGMDLEDVLTDEDFKAKLERQQTTRSNVQATSGVKGSGSNNSQAKNSAEYWIAKGVPPTAADVPDASARRKIARTFLQASKNGGKKFYND